MRGFQSYEEALESDSVIARAALPHAQAFTAEFLGLGNEEVHLGRESWLFYQPDVAYLTGPGFLDASFQRSRARSGDSSATRAIQPDPLKAVVQFRDQLKSRGIHLVIMPIPVKPMIEPEFLSPSYRPPLPIPLQNPSYGAFLKSLEKVQIDYLDVSHTLAEEKQTLNRAVSISAHRHPLDAGRYATRRGFAGRKAPRIWPSGNRRAIRAGALQPDHPWTRRYRHNA